MTDAIAALETARAQGRKIILITPPGASAYMGAGFFKALADEAAAFAPEALERIVYDCGDRPGDVLAGLRAGIRDFRLDEAVRSAALDALMAQEGARFFDPHAP